MAKYFVTVVILVLCLFFLLEWLLFSSASPAQESDVVELEGTVVQHQFVNKGGYETDYYELYFQTADELFYIKTDECEISVSELETYVDQVVIARVVLKEGAWDIHDEEDYQSRFGPYIAIISICGDTCD